VTWLAPYARRLVGVDLSAGMLAKARARGGYDELHEAELVAYLNAHPQAFDVVVSADTLCYFGRLEGACAGAAAALRTGGLIVFTVEAHELAADHWLQPHGRYSHRRGYVNDTLEAAGFNAVGLSEVVLRKEAGKPVHGLLVAARRGAAARGACVSAPDA
jgi:predicted TPR repeat methyltransferase